MPKTTPRPSTRADALTAALADAPKPDDHDGVREYQRTLAGLGCAPLLIYPASKRPADMRAPQGRSADDRAIREKTKAAGNRRWQQVKSDAGVHLATRDPGTLDDYLDRYLKTFGEGVDVNVAVSLGRSRVVVVDCDSAGQRAAFLVDADADPGTAPTVRSPGQRDPVTGDWAHTDGGHFWFVVPEGVDLPERPESMTVGSGDDAYSVLWGSGKYVLMPPSVRAEGPYTVTGEVYPLPNWLRDRIVAHGAARVERAQRAAARTDTNADPIAQWGSGIEWGAILAPAGWTPTGKADGCGCETWTAPGVHGSPKSATAHEPGCAQWTDSPDPPLHVWTDNPGEPFAGHIARRGTATVSKLQAVALLHYDDDMGAAMTALDLTPDLDALALVDDLPADFGRTAKADNEDDGSSQLPEAFWTAHPVLEHIRRFAHFGVNSADAVLGAALVRLSAHLDPCVRVVTGVKRPLPLNTFVGIVGSAGTGKSSAYHASADLLDFEFGNVMDVDLIAAADQRPPELPVGSGPGVAEAFMGTVIDPLDPKIKHRRQVRHKVLFHSDEGAGLVSGIIDAKRGQDIGPTLRAAWTGAVLGQANASAERTREVRDYSLGLCVGFQLEALAALSTAEQLEYGTPQRFVYVSATDPTIPDDAPDDPGPLTVPLPHGPLRYDDELRARARREALARARGADDDTGDDLMQAHRPALIARCAALLVVLCDPGRTEVNAGDVALAEMLLDTSARLHETAMEWRREREAAERERQLQGRIRESVATAVALDGRADGLKRLSDRIVRYVDEAAGGAVEWGGRNGVRKTKFDNADRQLADAALERLSGEDGPLVRDGNTVRRRS